MLTSESIKEISIALNNFQNVVEQPAKSANNPFFKSKYVPLENVMTTIKKHAVPVGLSYFQSTLTNDKGEIGVQTRIMHTSGEFIETEPLYLPNEKKNAQSAGSAITYARRYQLSAAFGIASDEDDDGNGAVNTDKKSSSVNSYKKKPEEVKKSNNDFFKNKKEVESRIGLLAIETNTTESKLKDFVISKTNKELGKDYKDFNSNNINASENVLVTLEKKAKENNKQEQTSMLENYK